MKRQKGYPIVPKRCRNNSILIKHLKTGAVNSYYEYMTSGGIDLLKNCGGKRIDLGSKRR